MEKKKRGIIGKLLVFVLTLMALAGLVAMAMSVVNGYVDPKRFVWTSFFGLGFWMVFIYNVLVLFALLVMRSRMAWVAVLALLVSVPGIGKSYSFGKKTEDEGSLRVMSYNVHCFSHIDRETSQEDCANAIIDFVREKNPDVFCCQEFTIFLPKTSRQKCVEYFAENAGFQYAYYNRKRNYAGNVIFSKFPIAKVDENSGFGYENTYGVMVEVDAGEKGRFFLADIHLLSYKITDKEIDQLVSSERRNKLDTIGMNVLRKLKYATLQRSNQIVEMLKGMPEMDAPVVVCGDFNDPPLSFTYRQMQKAGFVDMFTKVGWGIKPTYAGKLPLLRIDYIWGDKNIKPLNFKRFRYKVSDHYPIMMDFSIQK